MAYESKVGELSEEVLMLFQEDELVRKVVQEAMSGVVIRSNGNNSLFYSGSDLNLDHLKTLSDCDVIKMRENGNEYTLTVPEKYERTVSDAIVYSQVSKDQRTHLDSCIGEKVKLIKADWDECTLLTGNGELYLFVNGNASDSTYKEGDQDFNFFSLKKLGQIFKGISGNGVNGNGTDCYTVGRFSPEKIESISEEGCEIKGIITLMHYSANESNDDGICFNQISGMLKDGKFDDGYVGSLFVEEFIRG